MILKTVFETTFGGSGKYRLVIALLKLGSLLLLSSAIGYQLGSSLREVMAIQSYPLIYSGGIFLIQIATLCACLSMYGVISRQRKIYQLLQYLPVSRMQLYGCYVLPLGIVAVLAFPLLGVPLFMATHHTVINTLLLLVSILFGTISGMAFVWGKPVSISKTLWWLLSALFIWAEYKLLHLMTVANQHSLVIPGIVTAMHSLLGLLLLVNGLRNLQPKITDSKYLVGHNKPLPLFLKKILRNLPALLGVATSAGLGLAYVLLARRQPIVDTYATGITVALLSAILVCDFRALSRLVVPAEIANLRGTLFFTCSLLTASTAITMGALLPVLLLEPSHILIAFGFLIFGIGLGLLVGSILSPKSNDITGQCFATLICLAVVIGASKQQAFWELNPLLQFVVLSLVGIAAFIAAALVEFRRNHFIWRKYATGTQTK